MGRKEELDLAVQAMGKEDQLWLLNRIIGRWWPQFHGKAVGFYDPAEFWDDWDDKELDEFYKRKWEEGKP